MEWNAGGTGIAGLVLWFVVIVALIPLSLWLTKRSRWGHRLGQGPIQVLSQTPLGPGQRLVVVEVRHGAHTQTLLLGVTAHSVQLVSTLPTAAGQTVDETA